MRGRSNSEATNASKVRSRRGSTDSRFNAENLGDNFEDTPWLPPSIEKAIEFKEESIIRGGVAPLRTVKVCQASDLGSGVSLYFQFVKSMAVCMFFMSILSIPSLIFAYYGSRISKQDRDSMGLYQFTLGNIGYNENSPTYATDSACTSTTIANTTCVHIFGDKEYTLVGVGSILSFCEILQFIVFMATVYFLRYRTQTLEKVMQKEDTTVTDYTIMVRNLPTDVTFEQILSHFSHLYNLGTRDWQGRPPVEGAHPVRTDEVSNRSIHVNTWVAECTVFKKIGTYIAAFKDQEHLTTKLFRARAKMKMYAHDTPHAKGPNPRKYKAAEQEMNKTAMKIDALTETIIKTKNLAFNHSKMGFDTSADDHQDYNTQIDAPIVAAFITFEYSESMARCVEDYQKFATFPRNLFYPSELKFRGKRIKVHQAPEPDDIVFENLEIPSYAKQLRRLRTTFAMCVSLLICFIIILQASRYKQKFSNELPDLSLCPAVVPNQFTQAINKKNMDVSLTRPVSDKEALLDSQCSASSQGTFYAVYTEHDDYNDPVVSYDINVCSSKEGLCPSVGQTLFCPCVSVSSTQVCQYDCDINSQSENPCKSYEAQLIGDCYCFNLLSNLISSGSGLSFITNFNSIGTAQCKSFFFEYTGVQLLTYFATFLVVGINMILQSFLQILNRDEKHSSVSNEQGSFMLKMFIAQYINMALVVLVAFGKIENLPAVLVVTQIFQGTYFDFNSAWYGSVGGYLVLTFIIQTFSVPAYPLFQYFIYYPLCRCWVYPSIRKNKHKYIVMQDDLNHYEVGPTFETSISTAQALTLVFFSMTYATGLPLLMPLAFAAFFIFFNVDKMLICRFYHKPPRISEGVMHAVINYLPYAVIIRLGVACWMFGNSDFIPSTLSDVNLSFISSESYQNWLKNQHFVTWKFAADRVMRPNVFPLFALLFITSILTILRASWIYFKPFELIVKLISFALSRMTSNQQIIVNEDIKSVHPYDLMQLNDSLRQEVAPFSEQYFSYALDKDEIPSTCMKACCETQKLFLSEQEVIDGWVHVDHEKYILKCKVWTNPQKSDDDGPGKSMGDFKKTYEVIADAGCSSYNLELIPSYTKAIIGLEQGASNMEMDAALQLVDKKAVEAEGGHRDSRISSIITGAKPWEDADHPPERPGSRGTKTRMGAKQYTNSSPKKTNDNEESDDSSDDEDDDDDDDEEDDESDLEDEDDRGENGHYFNKKVKNKPTHKSDSKIQVAKVHPINH